jgi:integrase
MRTIQKRLLDAEKRLLDAAQRLQAGEITPAEANEITRESGRELAELRRKLPVQRPGTAVAPRKLNLTNARVRDLPTRDETVTYWDHDLAGFGVRIMGRSGTKTFILQRRTRRGRNLKIKLGRANEVSADWARRRALELIREIETGGDPAANLRAQRDAERERRRAPTVELMVKDWIEASSAGWRPSTLENYGRWSAMHVLPHLGRRKAAEVAPSDVRSWYRSLAATGRSVTANRCLAVLSSAFSWAVASDDWPTVTTNPCLRAISRREKAQEHKRERYPAGDELERLVGVLRDRGDLAGRFYLFLLLTGARRGEAGSARWSDFDLDADLPVWTKPRTATKQKRSHRLPLNAEAVGILREVRAERPFSPFGSLGESFLRKAWDEVIAAAGLSDLRVHDLRHWHASLLASMGLSLPMIGALLGHSSPGTTARYSHLVDAPLREATGGLGQIVDMAGRRS